MKIIGIHGKAGTGKDTVADYLVSTYGYNKISFAEPIRKMLKVIGVDPKTREEKEAPHPVFGVSFRYMAQTLGTEWMRELVREDGWVKLVEHQIKKHGTEGKWVIPDVRMPNEAEWVYKNGGSVIHLVRDVPSVRAHSSELGLEFRPDKMDCRIDNNGTVSELFWIVDSALKKFERGFNEY